MSFIKFFFVLVSLVSFVFSKNPNLLTDAQIQGKLNIVNGYSAECVMHKFYTNSGWTQIEGEIGRNGIDGLYFKKKSNIIKEVLVAESKWNSSKLSRSGKNKVVKQMSQEWVLRTLQKLQQYKLLSEYDSIKKLVQHNQYRARLFKISPVGKKQMEIHTYKIKNKGMKSFDIFKESTLKPITLGLPRNRFERDILESYNGCREEALERYFPMLNKESIKTLLKDNYLQKSDLKNYLKVFYNGKIGER